VGKRGLMCADVPNVTERTGRFATTSLHRPRVDGLKKATGTASKKSPYIPSSVGMEGGFFTFEAARLPTCALYGAFEG
jgi:hypothetical protein